MVRIAGPVEFLMGSPPGEADRITVNEPLHHVRIARSYAIASHEVTVVQFQRFLAANPKIEHSYAEQYAPESSCPHLSVTWYEAAAYCNWLTLAENLGEAAQCYRPLKNGEYAA